MRLLMGSLLALIFVFSQGVTTVAYAKWDKDVVNLCKKKCKGVGTGKRYQADDSTCMGSCVRSYSGGYKHS